MRKQKWRNPFRNRRPNEQVQQHLPPPRHPVMFPQAQLPLQPKENGEPARNKEQVVKISGQERRTRNRGNPPPVQDIGQATNEEKPVPQITESPHGLQQGTNQQAASNRKEDIKKENGHRNF
jgi:hypothetical protein